MLATKQLGHFHVSPAVNDENTEAEGAAVLGNEGMASGVGVVDLELSGFNTSLTTLVSPSLSYTQ